MKLVSEHLEFKQGGDPYEKLKLGKHSFDWKNPNDGDIIELVEDLYNADYIDKDFLNYNGETLFSITNLIEDQSILEYTKGTKFQFDIESTEWNELDEEGGRTGGAINHWWVVERTNNFKIIR